jgi:hypothetical protein
MKLLDAIDLVKTRDLGQPDGRLQLALQWQVLMRKERVMPDSANIHLLPFRDSQPFLGSKARNPIINLINTINC